MTTNTINNKKYVGQRKCPVNRIPENDPYLGSGTLLIRSVKKHGRENFSKEIIDICHSREDADRLENYYFEKFKVLENKDIFYNRGLAGQFWRPEGHSEFMSKVRKEYYKNPDNIKKAGAAQLKMTLDEYDMHINKREQKKHLFKINRKLSKAKKEIYNYYRELHDDLRQEFYSEKMRQKQKTIWKTKKYNPEFLEAVSEGKKKVDYTKCVGNSRGKCSKSNTKHKSIVYEKLWEKNLSVISTTISSVIRRYIEIKYKSYNSLKNGIVKIIETLKKDYDINIDFNELFAEAKIKYKHFFEA